MSGRSIDYTDLMTKAERLRKELGEDNYSPVNIFALAQNIEKLTLVYYPMGDTISGICIKGKDGRNTIAINSTMTLGRQRFSLAHEFYHLYYDENMMSICSKQIGSGLDTEVMADAFASYFLMPRAALIDKVESLKEKNTGKLGIQDIIRIEQFFGVSHMAAIYQLSNCGCITSRERNSFFNIGVRNIAKEMGFSTKLYCSLPKEKQYCTYGHYIDLAEQLLINNIISQGKYEELMLDAFRDDLVYGIEEGGEMID